MSLNKDLHESEKKNKDFFFTFAQGVNESTIILSNSAEKKLLELIIYIYSKINEKKNKCL